MASPTQPPVLIYDRIDANRRRTWLLLGVFALALLPFVAYMTPYLMLWVFMLVGMVLGSVLVPLGHSEWLGAEPIRPLLATGTIAVALVLLAVYVVYRFAFAVVLRISGARSVGREQEPALSRVVENLCLGAGLPPPRLYVIESTAANAFSTGRDPQHSSLVVTRGLLQLLDHRELEGVLAQELSQIGNNDTRLTTVVATLTFLLWLPLKIVTGFFRLLFRLHWILGLGCLLWFGIPVLMSIGLGLQLVLTEDSLTNDPQARLLWLVLMALPLFVFFGAPTVGLLVRKALSRERELLADADAALLTRYPQGLARALEKMGAGGNARLAVNPATAHLYLVSPLAGGESWWSRVWSTHPPLEERVALLSRMAGVLAPAVLEEARAAGLRFAAERNRKGAPASSGAAQLAGTRAADES